MGPWLDHRRPPAARGGCVPVVRRVGRRHPAAHCRMRDYWFALLWYNGLHFRRAPMAAHLRGLLAPRRCAVFHPDGSCALSRVAPPLREIALRSECPQVASRKQGCDPGQEKTVLRQDYLKRGRGPERCRHHDAPRWIRGRPLWGGGADRQASRRLMPERMLGRTHRRRPDCVASRHLAMWRTHTHIGFVHGVVRVCAHFS